MFSRIMVIAGFFQLCILAIAWRAAAQEDSGGMTLESLKNTLGDSTIVHRTFSELFNDPAVVETFNKVWQANVEGESRLLSNLNLEFKSFKVNEADTGFGLGFQYSYSRDIRKRRLNPNSQAGVSLSFSTEGNVAFEKEINPANFLDSNISFHLFKSWGGTIATTPAVRNKLNELETQLALIENKKELLNSPLLKEFVTLSKQNLRDQFYLDFAFAGGLESTQDFSAKQITFGANLGLDIKLWKTDYLNVFDWPFAAIRWLSGYDKQLEPLGASFPTLLLFVERVNPNGDSRRPDSQDFTRIHGEIGFRTPIASFSSFEANFRFYKELAPLQATEEAGLDQQIFFTASLITSNGMFFGYTTGKLPFDVRNDQVYQLGFRYHL